MIIFYKFKRPVKYATIKFATVIENGQPLKLCQMQQVVVFAFVLPDTQSAPNLRPSSHYLTHTWVSGKGLGQREKGGKGVRRR
jgi:hypothetical protein